MESDILKSIEDGLFYGRELWKEKREEVLRMDRHECQRCKRNGEFARAVIVHHIKHLNDRPDLALSIYDPVTGERQLESVCKKCHEELHPEALTDTKGKRAKAVTEERWD